LTSGVFDRFGCERGKSALPGGHEIRVPPANQKALSLLVIERDALTARRLVDVLGPAGVIRTLHDLYDHPLDGIDLVVCGLHLADGSGMDALAYLQGMRPDLPVVLTGGAADAGVGPEAIRAGATEFLVIDHEPTASLGVAVEKAFAHQAVRQENERLRGGLGRLLAELTIRNQQLREVVRQLENLARTDELTGLANRRWLNLSLEGHWAEAQRYGLPLAFVMIDLDGFKAVNDHMGHPRGDELLRMTARVIQANCRQVDIPARYGGDEFCVLMPHTVIDDAVTVAHRIHAEFGQAAAGLDLDGLAVGMSLGVAQNTLSRPVNADQLAIHADEALYRAKALGKGRVMVRERSVVVERIVAKQI
jgi:diguanylate cyclase (GGDEF)-like protein